MESAAGKAFVTSTDAFISTVQGKYTCFFTRQPVNGFS